MIKIKRLGSLEEVLPDDTEFLVRRKYFKHPRINGKQVRQRLFSETTTKKAIDLTKDDYIGIKIFKLEKPIKWVGIVKSKGQASMMHDNYLPLKNEKFWWFVGRFIADGWVLDYKRKGRTNSYSHRVVLCCGKHERKEVKDFMEEFNFNFGETEERTGFKYHIIHQELFEFLCMFGRYAYGKFIPPNVIDMPVEFLKPMLDGYFSGDGYVDKLGNTSGTTVSLDLALSLQKCVMKVYGVPVKLYHCKRNPTCVIEGRTVNQRDTYSIRFRCDVRKQDQAFSDGGYIWGPINKLESSTELPKTKVEPIIYNINDIKKKLTKCGHMSDFIREHYLIYLFLVKNNLLINMYEFLLTKNKDKIVETCNHDTVKIMASRCKSRTEFARKHPFAYAYARREKILDIICEHMDWVRIIWDDETLLKKSSECKNKTEFAKKYGGGYNIARKRGLLSTLYPDK